MISVLHCYSEIEKVALLKNIGAHEKIAEIDKELLGYYGKG